MFVRFLLTFTLLARSLRGHFLPPCSLRQLCLFFLLLLSSAPIPSAHLLSWFCAVPVVIVGLRYRPFIARLWALCHFWLPLPCVSLSCRRGVIRSLGSCLHMIYVLWPGMPFSVSAAGSHCSLVRPLLDPLWFCATQFGPISIAPHGDAGAAIVEILVLLSSPE